ncbi:hypothetical protein M9Y10_037363 [Tritrichomonas musculus]|uniref:TLD family protein n=1 Tax=Tritrichomonas musculus TaxID=1915356 RepID=A0ABR2GSD8_9EUKA
MDVNEHAIQALDLLSDAKFGLGCIELTDDWDEEEKQREIECQKLKFKTYRTKQLKLLARYGLSNSVRRRCWFILSGGFDLYLKVGDVYSHAVEATKNLPMDEKSFFGVSFNFIEYMQKPIAQILPTFLRAIWYNNQDVEFSPLIPTFSAMLLVFMEPSLAYLSLQAIINTSRESSYYLLLNKEQLFTTIEAVEKLIVIRFSSVANHAEKLGINLSQLILSIFPYFFIPFISGPVSLTIFDSFVSEGRKVLFRFFLQILYDEKSNLTNTNDPNEFGRLIFNAVDRLNDPNKMKAFIKKAFKIKMKRRTHIEKLEEKASGIPENIKKQLNQQMDATFSMIPQHPQNFFIPNIRRKRVTTLNQYDNSLENSFTYIERLKKRISMSNLLNQCEIETMKNIQAQIAQRCLPVIYSCGQKSMILNEEMLLSIRSKLPSVFRLYSAVLVYKMTVNGRSFQSLFEKCTCQCQYIMLIKTTNEKVIGAFLSDPPLPNNNGCYFGSQMTTVFDMNKKLFFKMKVPANKCFMFVSEDVILVGGPDPALSIKNGFKIVFSKKCDTFKSPVLTENEAGDDIAEVELYGFLPNHYVRQRRNSINALQKNI